MMFFKNELSTLCGALSNLQFNVGMVSLMLKNILQSTDIKIDSLCKS